MGANGTYKARQWNLARLKGISGKTLEMHFELYEGYVAETNRLTEQQALDYAPAQRPKYIEAFLANTD